MRVLFLTKYGRVGASSRYRSLQYLPHLETLGIDCSVQNFFDDDYLRRLYATGRKSLLAFIMAIARRLAILLDSSKFDLLVIEKELISYCPAIFERILHQRGVRFVVDYDDALFHRYDHHRLGLVRTFLGNKIATVMKSANAVVAGNDYLAQYATRSGATNVHILPTVVDLRKYTVKTDFSAADKFTIGWIGSLTTTEHLRSVRSAFEGLRFRNEAKLLLIGAGHFEVDGMEIESHPWSEETEVELLKRCDVGIMPLPDAPWERGKCGFKLIQYMACGLPVIGSPVGANCRIIVEGENGFFASSPREWQEALSKLRESPALRRRMGTAGREMVAHEYSLQVQAPKLAEILRAVAG